MPCVRSRMALVTSFDELWISSVREAKSITTIPYEFVGYACGQIERCPDTGREHVQMFVQGRRDLTKMQFQKVSCDMKANVKFLKFGDGEDMKEYCMKEDTRVAGPWEYGVFVTKGSKKRKDRDDVERSPERMREDEPEKYIQHIGNVSIKIFKENYVGPTLDYNWELLLTGLLDKGPVDRKIIWVIGRNGNDGKSTYAKHLVQEGWFYTRGGKSENIMYNYVYQGHQRHVVWDIPRDKQDMVQYGLIEKMKDRYIESTKYRPISFIDLIPVHVVIFANFLPDREKLSEDRWVIIVIDKNKNGTMYETISDVE